jgi:6-phosphogluconolactonase
MMNTIPTPWDDRRVLHIFPTAEQLVTHAAEDFIRVAREAIATHGNFSVALAGGSTPLALYQLLGSPRYAKALDWNRVWLFWGDERAVPVESPQSNYGEAMRAGLSNLPIPQEQIFRMQADSHLDAHARLYDEILRDKLPRRRLDLVLLGVGEDGHTASLFPMTKALDQSETFCVSNWVPHLEAWRMTLTFPGLALADRSWLLVTGSKKADILAEILTDLGGQFPASRIGSAEHPACFLVDRDAASLLPIRLDG